jgi:putative thioredoxin
MDAKPRPRLDFERLFMEPLIGAAKPAPASPDLIKDGDIESFMTDVIEASMQTPVIVDFWAPWCGPCKQLGPAIEKAVRDAKGAVKLVKINIDENPEIAQQMRIQSIPAVYAFKGGRPVDGFVGALPESQIKQFIQKLGGKAAGAEDSVDPVAAALQQAQQALTADDIGTASALFGQVLAHDKANVAAASGLARCYVAADDLDKARQLLESLPADAKNNAEVKAALSAIEVAEQAKKSGPISELEARVAANPKDHEARFDLAVALFNDGRQQEALDHLLDLFRLDRKWNDGAARAQIVKFFEVLGTTHPLTVSGRKRLSSLMFA